MSGDDYGIQVFPVKVENGLVYVKLPPTDILDQHLATEIGCSLATSCNTNPELLPVLN